MKKNILQLFIILILLLFFCNYTVLANNTTYDAPLSFDISNLYYRKNWSGENCIAGNINIYEIISGTLTSLSRSA